MGLVKFVREISLLWQKRTNKQTTTGMPCMILKFNYLKSFFFVVAASYRKKENSSLQYIYIVKINISNRIHSINEEEEEENKK